MKKNKKKVSKFKQVNEALEAQRLAKLGNSMVLRLPVCFSNEEIDQLRAYADQFNEQAAVGQISSGKKVNSTFRRSQGCAIPVDEFQWVYKRILDIAKEINKLYLFDIDGKSELAQLAIYDEADKGFYTWHSDTSPAIMTRKISISVPLSSPDEYEGGALQFILDGEPRDIPQAKGALISFPSYELHRVTPVTKGRRYSLVIWLSGPSWR
jgi:PKHD-type hydroxylase